MLNLPRRRWFRSSRPVSTSNQRAGRRRRALQIERLEDRFVLTGPTLGAIPSQTLLAGRPLEVPINAASPSGFALTYSVSSTNAAISASLPTGNPDLVLNVTHTSSGQLGDTTFSGTLTIELFPNAAPTTVQEIENLVNSGFYNGLQFDRIFDEGSLIGIQAAQSATAPAGTPTLDEEFNPALAGIEPYTAATILGPRRRRSGREPARTTREGRRSSSCPTPIRPTWITNTRSLDSLCRGPTSWPRFSRSPTPAATMYPTAR